MTLSECLNVLDVNENSSIEEILKNFKWLVWFYHPDNLETGNCLELRKTIQAFEELKTIRAISN